jgi:tRNA(fMet)-specific endonuclease VapC
MIRFLLDTNICIFVGKSRWSDPVAQRFARAGGNMAMSAITFAELQFGIAFSAQQDQNRAALATLVIDVPVLAFDEPAAVLYGFIRADLKRRGTMIGGNDLLIAAHALANDLILVTNNTREFARVQGLKVEDWTVRA